MRLRLRKHAIRAKPTSGMALPVTVLVLGNGNEVQANQARNKKQEALTLHR